MILNRNGVILWSEAVTDRQQSDVDRLNALLEKGFDNLTNDEKAEWISGLKASFNHFDVERIENNIQLLSDVLELDLQTYLYDIPEYPTETYFAILLYNVGKIRSAYAIHIDTPNVPKIPINTYGKVNDIEKILQDVYEILLNNFHYYCGNEIYAGDSFGLLL